MQTVFTNDMVAHVWAQQSQDHGRNSGETFYFNGATVYSYGSHFPIARFVGNGSAVLFTTDDYSTTTSTHISRVHRAIGRQRIFMVPDVMADDTAAHRANIADYVERANDAVKRATKRRKADLADMDLEAAASLSVSAREYALFFDIAAKRILAKLPNLESLDIADLRRQLAERDRKAKEAARRKLAADARKWLSGEGYSLRGYPEVLLRVSTDGNEIETSEGARVPFPAAVTMWRALERGHDIKGARVGFFRVDSVTAKNVHIGCHTVPRAEMSRLAESLGLKA